MSPSDCPGLSGPGDGATALTLGAAVTAAVVTAVTAGEVVTAVALVTGGAALVTEGVALVRGGAALVTITVLEFVLSQGIDIATSAAFDVDATGE